MSLDDPNASKSTGTPATATPASPEPPKPAPPPPAAPAAAQLPPQIQDFDELIKKDVQNFVKLGEKIGGLVEEQVSIAFMNTSPSVSNWSISPKQFSKPSRPSAPTFTFLQRRRSPSLSLRSS